MTVRIHTYIWKIALGCRSDLHSYSGKTLTLLPIFWTVHFDFRDCILQFVVSLSVKVRAFA